MKTLIIAEAGVNHNGDMNLAKQLIDVAATAGADLVKFQTFSAQDLVIRSVPKANYQIEANNKNESQYEMLRNLELTEEMHLELIAYSQSKNIEFFSTGFDIKSLEMLIRLGQNKFKIPSGEITNIPLLRFVGKQNKHVIISTGMSDMDEIAQAITVLKEAGTHKDKITILHCTSAYPAPYNEINLRALLSIKESFGISVGYSDHSSGIEVAIAAVSLGACVIEKHFTLDKALRGPDHKASLDPMELKKMIAAIRNIELALGDGVKQLMPCEIDNQNVVRKYLVAKTAIKKDEVLSVRNLTTKRTGYGISASKWDQFIGKKSSRDYSVDEIIDL
jgi:N,N'-diacetyllegionaminate synthase